ncbi:hypothetical protein CMQ_4660 [Grosmannia clavigera kw1407]|uniref:Uncharacterized protein n=1 Tax=Grosmannia clavigera (strain kw1407 / UAMH 11150) TaxID=655863 RepID=F0XTD8_GROCL|nr:uncharacterized protein CMQ_4660 [Grosmannia clavigera kw1407]EFW98808.1 hypothetical protein CMQ_4660 [Grosmannia clavigera kw1407]
MAKACLQVIHAPYIVAAAGRGQEAKRIALLLEHAPLHTHQLQLWAGLCCLLWREPSKQSDQAAAQQTTKDPRRSHRRSSAPQPSVDLFAGPGRDGLNEAHSSAKSSCKSPVMRLSAFFLVRPPRVLSPQVQEHVHPVPDG